MKAEKSTASLMQPVYVVCNFDERALLAVALGKPVVVLTRRERQLLQQLVGGFPNKVIAYHLGLKHETVKLYMSRLFRKIGVPNRTSAVAWAMRNLEGVNHTTQVQ
jgi:DNA-binding NarL/FixJ family response regulator